MDEAFPGFDEVKSQFPTAEHLPIAIDLQGPASSFFAAVAHLIGKINDAEFQGKAAETVWFSGPVETEDEMTLRFVHRPEGWKTTAAKAGAADESDAAGARCGEPTYIPADFTPLEALIGGGGAD